MNDELLDLVDENDNKIGTVLRNEYYHMPQKPGYVRAVEMLIVNSRGELWIPTRTADKRIAPGGLDYSAGGHVGAGQTYMEAALRETQEELNLNLQPSDLELCKAFTPDTLPYFRKLYMYRSDIEPQYNPEDFASAEWLSVDELIAKLTAGVPAKASLHKTITAAYNL